MTDCCLQCDCDECINRGGGTVLEGAGKRHYDECAEAHQALLSKFDELAARRKLEG